MLVLPYAGVAPEIAAPPLHAAPDAAVLGRVTLGAGARLESRCVIRADGHFIRIGDEFHLGPRSTLHIVEDLYPAILGDRVTVGANACVHACTVGSDCVIEDDAVVLYGSVVADEVIVERASVVFPRSRLQRGFVYAGAPAKQVRPVRAGEIAERRHREFEKELPFFPAAHSGAIDATAFIAQTAHVRGKLTAQTGCSIWFGCDFDAGDAAIALGANVNVQDNTLIRCATAQGVTIGRDSSIGHNVLLHDCRIGAEALVGIGSALARGTVLEDRALLAAGGRTVPDQVLEGGWLWGGDPARRIVRLDDGKRELISLTVRVYCVYARNFKAAQAAA